MSAVVLAPIIGGASVIVLGAWLRWATRPVVAAFRLGRSTGRRP